MSLSQFIRDAPWAMLIPTAELARIEAAIVERSLDAGEFIYKKGDPPAYWIGVMEGELRMVRFSKTGKMATLSRVAPGAWIGEASLLFLTERRFDVIAQRGSRIACIPKEAFAWLFANSVPFNNYLVHKLARRMAEMATMLTVDRLQGGTARTAFCIVKIAEVEADGTDEGSLRISQEDLGFMAGLSRQHANRAVASLEKDGLITLHNRRIVINNLEGLKRLCDI